MTGVVISDKNVNVTVSKFHPGAPPLLLLLLLLTVYCNSLASSRCSVTGLIQRWDSIQIILADALHNVRVPQSYFSFPETFFSDICMSLNNYWCHFDKRKRRERKGGGGTVKLQHATQGLFCSLGAIDLGDNSYLFNKFGYFMGYDHVALHGAENLVRTHWSHIYVSQLQVKMNHTEMQWHFS